MLCQALFQQEIVKEIVRDVDAINPFYYPFEALSLSFLSFYW